MHNKSMEKKVDQEFIHPLGLLVMQPVRCAGEFKQLTVIAILHALGGHCGQQKVILLAP